MGLIFLLEVLIVFELLPLPVFFAVEVGARIVYDEITVV